MVVSNRYIYIYKYDLFFYDKHQNNNNNKGIKCFVEYKQIHTIQFFLLLFNTKIIIIINNMFR